MLGVQADRIMKELYEASGGRHGDRNGYQEYGHNRVPASEPCDDCKALLNSGGCIIIAQDIGEYLRLSKEDVDRLIGRIDNGKGQVLDLEAMRGKVSIMQKAFWKVDEDNICLRDPKEWA